MIHTILIHKIKVAFESIHVSGPEPAELRPAGRTRRVLLVIGHLSSP